MTKYILALAAIMIVPSIGNAQSKEMLLGTWRLVSESNVTDKFFAYAGRYTLSGNTVTHHIEVAWIQGWANTDQVRRIDFQGDQLVLRTTTPFQQDGAEYAYQELTWDRVK